METNELIIECTSCKFDFGNSLFLAELFESIADELLERIGLTKMNVDYSTYMSLDPVAIRKDYFIDFDVETLIKE